MSQNENIEKIRNLLRKKFPSNAFFEERKEFNLYHKEITEDVFSDGFVFPSNVLCIYETKTRKLTINKEELDLLPELILKIQSFKSDKEIKKEKLFSYRNELKEEFNKKIESDKDFFNQYLPNKDIDFCTLQKSLGSFINSVCKMQKNIYDMQSIRSHIQSKIDQFKEDLIKIKKSKIKFDGKPLSSFQTENKIFLFKNNILLDYILLHSDVKEELKKEFIFEIDFFGTPVALTINVKDTIPFEVCNIENLITYKGRMKKFDFLSDFNISNNDLENYVNETFETLIKDNKLINKDLLLKESIYENYYGKITQVKSENLECVIDLPVEIYSHYDNEKTLQIIKNKIIKTTLDVHERRLAGLKRSITRKVIQNIIEIDSFKNLFPEARKQKRKLYFLCGETNSGKTYTAFERAVKHKNGLYAAPLRLLALEGQQEIEKRGKLCSMITGEERDVKDGANFISSTVEMIDYSKEYDVAIIDEIQLINDRDRGHAWFEALIGINAKEIYLVGSEDISKVLDEIAQYLDEEIEKEIFERKTKIQFSKDLYKNSLNENGKLPKNSAVIAFSKNKVLELKSFFEEKGNKVSVIYGALPPEVRRFETERFVSGETDMIISTDAIGMGLNLPIENIFFYEKQKYNGYKIVDLDIGLIKQIVGRAGRFGKFDIGYVSALDEETFDFINEEFYKDSFINERFLKCSPNYPIMKQLLEITKEESMFKLLQNYNNAINFDFDIKNHMGECSYTIAKHIDSLGKKELLKLIEKVKLINAPVSRGKGNEELNFFKDCIKDLYFFRANPELPTYDFALKRLNTLKTNTQKNVELSIKKIDIISWLSFNFDEFFVIEDDIKHLKKSLNKKLIKYLKR